MFCNHKCTKFSQLILRKIIKIVATRCQILRLKCTKSDLGWGSAPDPSGELTVLPRLPAGFKGPTSKGREGKGREGGEGREGRVRKKGKGKAGGKGKGGESVPLALILQFDHWLHIDDSMHAAPNLLCWRSRAYTTICCLQPTVMFLCSS